MKKNLYQSIILCLSPVLLIGCSKETGESEKSVKQSTEVVSQKEAEHTTEDSSEEATEKTTQVDVTEEAFTEEQTEESTQEKQTETEPEEAGNLNYGTVKRSGITDPKKKYFVHTGENFIGDGVISLPERLENTAVWDEIQDQVRLELWKKPDYPGADIMLRKGKKITSEVSVNFPDFWDPQRGFNNTVSYLFSCYYELHHYETVGMDYKETVGYKYWYKVYSLKTGQELHLRDFFYEDTDYITLLNNYIGGKYTADSEDSCLFHGITPDQDFYFDSQGNIFFNIDGNGKTIPMSYLEFAEISAISEFVEEQDLNYMPKYSDLNGNIPFSGIKEERPSFHGIEGITENVIISYPEGTPESILEFIQNGYLDSYSCLDEGLLADHHRTNPGEKLSVHTDARVDRLGPFYCVDRDQAVYQCDFEGEYDLKLYGFYGDWDNINERILFDPDGNQITWNQLFSDPEQVYSLIADALAESNVTDAEITGNIPNFDGGLYEDSLTVRYTHSYLDYVTIDIEDLYPYFDDSYFQ